MPASPAATTGSSNAVNPSPDTSTNPSRRNVLSITQTLDTGLSNLLPEHTPDLITANNNFEETFGQNNSYIQI